MDDSSICKNLQAGKKCGICYWLLRIDYKDIAIEKYLNLEQRIYSIDNEAAAAKAVQ